MRKNTTAIAILFIILFLVMVGFGIVIPIMPFFITHLGGGPTILGLFMASYSLMQFFFSPFWGRLSDRIGRRPVILVGLSGYAITFIFFGFANNLWMRNGDIVYGSRRDRGGCSGRIHWQAGEAFWRC